MEERIVYSYLPNTKEYSGTTIARQDPMDPDNFLLPAYTTIFQPPEVEENYVAVYNEDDETWTQEVDYRGSLMYNKETAEESFIDFIGDIPDEFTLTPKPGPLYSWNEEEDNWTPDLNKVKDYTKERLKEEYERILKEPIDYNDNYFNTDIDSQIEIYGIISLGDQGEYKLYNTDYDLIDLSYQDIINIGEAIQQRNQTLKLQLDEKNKLVGKSKSIKTIQKVGLVG